MSSYYFYIFFIFLSFGTMYIITIYLQTLFAFKKNYSQYKCNPLVMPFSAAFGENPKDVFNECVEAEQTKTTDKFTEALFSSLESNNKNMEETNNMNAGVIISQGEFKNDLLGNDNMKSNYSYGMSFGEEGEEGEENGEEKEEEESGGGLLPALGETQKNISIQTTRMAVASKNVTDVLMANIKAIILLLEGVPVVAQGVLNSPPVQMVYDIAGAAGN